MSKDSIKALFRPELEELKAYKVPASPPEVKLDANESPWTLPGEAWERIVATVRDSRLNRYPDGGTTRLRDALSTRFGGGPEEYVVGAGSDELIALLATAMGTPRPGEERPTVVVPGPTFVMYGMTHRAHGWRAAVVPLDEEWDLDVEAMTRAFDRERPNLVYYASPNNPTGNCFSRERLEALVSAFPDTLHVIDEAYAPFSGQSAATWCGDYPQCALMGTLSKVGFAGVRVGWIRLDPEFAGELEKVRQPFNLNTLSQSVATLALTELAPALEASINAIVSERHRLAGELAKHKALTVYRSDANFVLVSCEIGSEPLSAALLERQIAVRRFAAAVGRLASCVRITVGTPEENDRLIQALDEIL